MCSCGWPIGADVLAGVWLASLFQGYTGSFCSECDSSSYKSDQFCRPCGLESKDKAELLFKVFLALVLFAALSLTVATLSSAHLAVAVRSLSKLLFRLLAVLARSLTLASCFLCRAAVSLAMFAGGHLPDSAAVCRRGPLRRRTAHRSVATLRSLSSDGWLRETLTACSVSLSFFLVGFVSEAFTVFALINFDIEASSTCPPLLAVLVGCAHLLGDCVVARCSS